jgi:hypothetical protein
MRALINVSLPDSDKSLDLKKNDASPVIWTECPEFTVKTFDKVWI